MKYFINSVDKSGLVIDYSLNKKTSFLGKISANGGSLTLDTIQSYTFSDLEGKVIVIKDDDDNIRFTGKTLKAKLSIDKKTMQLPFTDKWQEIKNTSCDNKTWKNTSLKTVIENVIAMTTETSYNVDDPSLTVVWYSVSENDKVMNVLEDLAQSIAADCFYDSDGVLQFTAGFNAAFSTTTVKSFDNSGVGSITTEEKANIYDYSSVKFTKPEFMVTKDKIFVGASDDGSWLIPAAGIGVDEDYLVKMSKKIHMLEVYADVSFSADAELTFDETTYNTNFQSGTQPKLDSEIQIKITNSSALTKEVTELIIEGMGIREVKGTATYTTGKNVLQTTSKVITDAVWAGKLAQYRFEQSTDIKIISISLAELSFSFDLKEKIIYDSERYVIDAVNMTATSINIKATKDRDAAFSYTSSEATYVRDSDDPDYYFADGLAPATPTGLSLANVTSGQVAYVQASWSTNTETDMKGYEAQWSYDDTDWFTVGIITDLSYTFQTRPNQTIYFRLRATDIEGLESAWSASVSITSATGSGNPDWTTNTDAIPVPSSISASTSIVATIEVNWDITVDYNTNYISVERAVSPYSSFSEVAKIKGTSYVDLNVAFGTSYKYKARTGDFLGNFSAYSGLTAEVTPGAYNIGDGVDPTAPTNLSLTPSVVDYVSVITASWDASVSLDVLSYTVEYRERGKVWGDGRETKTEGLSIILDVNEQKVYDVRVKAVDVEEKQSAYITDSVTSADITGDTSEPNSYGFVDADCSAVIENGKRYAVLEWAAYSAASDDIRNFHIRYSNEADDAVARITRAGPTTVSFDPSIETEVTFRKDVFKAYIEIPTTDSYSFGLIVEDWDGYRRIYINTATPANDGFIIIDFSGAVLPVGTLYAPTTGAVCATYNYMEIQIATEASGTEKDWILQVQCVEITAEWGDSTFDFSGDVAYQFDDSESYYIFIYLETSEEEKVYKARTRFKDKNRNVSDWSTIVYDTIPIRYGSVPTTPTTLTVAQVTEGSYNFIKLNCNEVSNAEGYTWYISYHSTLSSAIYFEVSTTENEVYIEVPSFSYLYNYAHVIATNSYGDSNKKTVATGW